MSFTTRFTCTHCNRPIEEPGTSGGETVFLIQHNRMSIAHQACKPCKVLIENHNAQITQQKNHEKEMKKLAEQQAAAAQAAPQPTIMPYGQPQYAPPPPPPQVDPYMQAFQAVAQMLIALQEGQRQLGQQIDDLKSLVRHAQEMQKYAISPAAAPYMPQPQFPAYQQNPYAQQAMAAYQQPQQQYQTMQPPSPVYGLPHASAQILNEMMRDR